MYQAEIEIELDDVDTLQSEINHVIHAFRRWPKKDQQKLSRLMTLMANNSGRANSLIDKFMDGQISVNDLLRSV